jgi:ADP-ribosylglycohydrolase
MTRPSSKDDGDRIAGLLLGAAIGDALGLPAEGMSRQAIRRRWDGKWRMRLVFGRGMVSDDTEHTLMVATSLMGDTLDAESFQQILSWKMRWWFLGLPAGVGLATARACLKLWLGFGPRRCGVFSAGNGPAMRSAVIGAYFSGDPEKRREFVSASTRMTHIDPRAEVGALAVAESAAWEVNDGTDPNDLLIHLASLSAEAEWRRILALFGGALEKGESVEAFADSLGLAHGVSGYAYHTVPVALYAWLRHRGDFRGGLEAALNCGGDTDTVGAIVGALAGVTVGLAGIPREWIDTLCDWPNSRGRNERIAAVLAENKAGRHESVPRFFWPGQLVRNVVFLVIVLVHGLRRLF